LTTATPSIVSNFHQQLYQIQNSHSALYSLILVKLSQKKKKKKDTQEAITKLLNKNLKHTKYKQ
jgi:hypothetical protein